MPYRFTNIIDATTYLTSLGFTVREPMLNWITPLRSSSKRAELLYAGKDVGYIETPTHLLPDEDWNVNIPFEKRNLVPEGVLNAIFGNTSGNEGWENRQFYLESNRYTKFCFGSTLQHWSEAKGPSSTIYLKTDSDLLTLTKQIHNNVECASLSINIQKLLDAIPYKNYVEQRFQDHSEEHDDRFVKLSGSTMYGYLLLNDTPTLAKHAATKKYVDDRILNHASAHQSDFVNLVGSTMTGFLTLHNDPTNELHAATKRYVDNQILAKIYDLSYILEMSDYLGLDDRYVKKDGATITGHITNALTPTHPNHLTNKSYVDFKIDNHDSTHDDRYMLKTNRYMTFTIGNNTDLVFTLTHNFGTRALTEVVYKANNYEKVKDYKIYFTDTNNATIEFTTKPTTNGMKVNLYRLTV